MKYLYLIGLFALAACATPLGTTGSVPGIPAAVERVDSDAATAYALIATAVNSYELLPSADKVKGEALKATAWNYFNVEHNLYKSGIAGDISALLALVPQAQALGH